MNKNNNDNFNIVVEYSDSIFTIITGLPGFISRKAREK